MTRLTLLLMCCVAVHPRITRAAEPTIYMEAEIQRGAEVSKMSLFVLNQRSEDLQLGTGSATGGHNPVEGEAGGGSGIYPPKLRFAFQETKLLELWAASRLGGIAHSQRMQQFVVPAGQRRLYCSFFVASAYVRGDYLGGTVDVMWNGTRLPLLITRVIERGPMNVAVLSEAANPATEILADVDAQHADPPPKHAPKTYGELLVKRGDLVSELEVWFVNELDYDIHTVLYIPAGHQQEQPETRDSRTLTVFFDSSFGLYALHAPFVRERPPQGELGERRIRLEAGQRILLSRFKVPTIYLAGGKGFLGGAISTSMAIVPIRVAKLVSTFPQADTDEKP